MREKLRCMGSISQGVYVVGVRMGGSYNLMTASFVAPVSFNPCSIALSVSRRHYTVDLLREQGAFALSVLAEGQEEVARRCGCQSGRKTDKSRLVAYDLAERGLPVIREATAYLICKVRQTVDYEDRVLFLAEVEKGSFTERPPLHYVPREFFPPRLEETEGA